jgi:dynein heavy chain, axonemal
MLDTIEKCLQMNEEYQDQYRLTKEKLITTPKGKQFDFSESQIFGKFDLFCRRLIKLMDMFSTMQQFRNLAQQKFDGLDPLIIAFNDVVKMFRSKGHDLLDFGSNRFDRDYVDFNVKMHELESSLQHFINRSFQNIGSIEESLTLLKRYQEILHRENLRSDLDSKLTLIFHNYGLELARVEQIYEKNKHDPPIARNMPPVAGNIAWARHLLKKIEDPMKKFQGSPSVLASKESKKIIRTYNKVAKTLIAFEYLWYEAWCSSIEQAKAGLQATLIIRHPTTQKLYVNFDQELFQLIREAKCLAKLNVDIPESAKIVLLQEEKFKEYYNDLKYLLTEYDRVTEAIIPVTAKLFEPHLQTMEIKLRPGLITLTWTSMNIDTYKSNFSSGLSKLEDMVHKMNDITESRIQKNLKSLSRAVLCNLPDSRTVALDEFVTMQEGAVRTSTTFLTSKNLEVELAVNDLFDLLRSHAVDPSVDPIDENEVAVVFRHFNSMTYQALLNCVKVSLNYVKKRTCSRIGANVLFSQKPFFEVDVSLSVPSARLSPSLDDIQGAINRAAVAVIGSAKKMWQWNQKDIPDKEKSTFFDVLGQDLEIIKTVLLLTGALHGTKNLLYDYLRGFKKYDWLWKDDKELAYKAFMVKKPTIQDFEEELKKFMAIEEEISNIASHHCIGAVMLNTVNLKLQLSNESRQWKVLYSNKVHQLAKQKMNDLTEYIRLTNNKLNYEVNSLDSLRYVMNVLVEIRDRESSIEFEITPILDMYAMIEHYLPGGVVDKDEVEQKINLRQAWLKLVDFAEIVTNNLSSIQGVYQKELIKDIRDFMIDIKSLRNDFENNGPTQPGISPNISVERLKKFKRELEEKERKMEHYRAGEELFALRPSRFNEIIRTRKEVNLIDQLFSLWVDVNASVKTWSILMWTDVSDNVSSMTDTINNYEGRCKKLPKRLREYQAFDEVRKQIDDYILLFPMLSEMSKPSIKKRHWDEICGLLSKPLPYEDESFSLKDVLESDIVEHKEEVEEICDGADKQLAIERKMIDLRETWATAAFEFAMWKTREIPVLKAFGYVIEELEEAQLQLQTLLSIRHVTPFRDDVQKFLTELSDTADTLEMWVKVQMLWTSLESVFLGGDIAKQMPIEAKKFAKINKDWEKLMIRASETKLVVPCCSNELLRTTLPVLYSELEKCQKSLEGYLEQKRGKFPRFYFVSNPVLLIILSQGSDPLQMQPFYEKVFDSIDRVTHSRSDKAMITELQSIIGSTKETINLLQPVKAHGNIEDWLGEIEMEMQRTMKRLAEDASIACTSMPLRQFVDRSCGQFALLGLQIMWTIQCTEALAGAKKNKQGVIDNNRAQLAILQELSGWCLTDLGS